MTANELPTGSKNQHTYQAGGALARQEAAHSPVVPAPVNHQAQQMAAGWYPDSVPHQERWWDGSAWTDATRPVTGAQINTVVVQHAPQTNQPVRMVKLTKSQHTTHTLLTLFTFGAWLPVYALHFLLASPKAEPLN